MSGKIKKQFVVSEENSSFLAHLNKEKGTYYSFTANKALDFYRESYEGSGDGLHFAGKYANSIGVESLGKLFVKLLESVIQAQETFECDRLDFITSEAYEEYKQKVLEKRRIAKLKRVISNTLTLDDATKIVGDALVQHCDNNIILESEASLQKFMDGDYEAENICFLKLDTGEIRVFTFALNKMKK